MNLEEKQLSKKYVYKGKILKFRVDQALLPDGTVAGREVVEHPGGVCVVALTDKNEILAVKQFRYPYFEILTEIPAGKFDSPDEIPLEAAKRELKEETGAKAKTMIDLGVIYPSPGCYGESLYMFAAKDLEFGDLDPDDDEFLEVLRIPLEKFYEQILSGEIKDAKTIIGVLKIKEKIVRGEF